ncbi:hypothetical protein TrCOL_g6313 [Triparma columacea]|uniref:SET domain-containing protein n=1 Tax=Triparma columacea TaxID=722753 RepID=A0A9W7GC07_9STRA|nr:hypothetical protein TrCOL_g6313 [Triparma columacea]
MSGWELFGDTSSDEGGESHPPVSIPVSTPLPDQRLPSTPVFTCRVSNEISGGLGLHAKTLILQGTEIHREKALIRCPNGHAAASEGDAIALHVDFIAKEFEKLPADGKELFMSLCNTVLTTAANSTYGIFQSNAVRLSGRDHLDGAVFPTFCRCNHSCRPNIRHQWRPDLQELLLYAVVDIQAGEEMYTTYNGGAWGQSSEASTKDRREYLMKHFGFHCMCRLCTESDALVDKCV